jgi:hypothetical protein
MHEDVPSPSSYPTADARPADAAFSALATALWTERETLDQLQFRLVSQRLFLRAGVGRWLGLSDDEIRMALTRLHTEELVRAAEVEALRAVLGVSSGATLDAIVRVAPSPWGLVLAETREALRELISEVDSGMPETRRLLTGGAAAARRSLDQLPRSASGSDTARAAELADLTTSQLAVQLASTSACYDAALRTADAIDFRSLRDFVA